MMYASTKDFFKSYLEGLAVELQVRSSRRYRQETSSAGMCQDGHMGLGF